jgi:predicted RNA-binding protein
MSFLGKKNLNLNFLTSIKVVENLISGKRIVNFLKIKKKKDDISSILIKKKKKPRHSTLGI